MNNTNGFCDHETEDYAYFNEILAFARMKSTIVDEMKSTIVDFIIEDDFTHPIGWI